MQNTLDRILNITGMVFGVEHNQIGGETRIVENLNADSIEVAEFAIDLEKEFELSLGPEDITSAGSLSRLAEIIDKKLAHKGKAL
jgi:acyl carrier protein